MKNMLYLSNVSWTWIKQRPQFLAEELGQYYEVDVCAKLAYKNKANTEESENVNLNNFRMMPFQRFACVRVLNYQLYSNRVKRMLKKKLYDYIWIASPEYYFYIKENIPEEAIVIYDCMDDSVEFKKTEYEKQLYLQSEKMLINRANIVFASAEHLRKVLLHRYNGVHSYKIKVLNNGLAKRLMDNIPKTERPVSAGQMKNIVYIGTISEWFDFDLIISSLQKFDNIKYTLYGPVDIEMPSHERLAYKGFVEHEKIDEIMKNADLLIMPFKLNTIVESVNPVKLYEYISSRTPVVSIRYRETEKFAPFVYLYDGEEEFFDILYKLINDKLNVIGIEEVKKFLNNNLWEKRALKIKTWLDEFEGK